MQRFLSLLFLFSVFISCSSDTVKKRDILEDDKFRELLIDFHKAEGIITIAKLNQKKNKNDTISPYNFVLKKHNVSRFEFERTIEYYSIHTDEYVLFYDSINNYFSEKKKKLEIAIEEDLKEMTPKKQFAASNLWKKKQEWTLNKMRKNNPFKFNIKTHYSGTYVIIMDVFSSPKYKFFNERVLIVANYEDGTSTSSNNIELSENPKNSKLEKYDHIELSIKTDKNKKLKSISGHILNYNEKKQHFHLRNIEIKYIIQNKNKNIK